MAEMTTTSINQTVVDPEKISLQLKHNQSFIVTQELRQSRQSTHVSTLGRSIKKSLPFFKWSLKKTTCFEHNVFIWAPNQVDNWLIIKLIFQTKVLNICWFYLSYLIQKQNIFMSYSWEYKKLGVDLRKLWKKCTLKVACGAFDN